MPGIWQNAIVDTRNRGNRLWAVFSCGKCGGLVLAERTATGGDIKQLYPDIQDVDPAISDSKIRHFLREALVTKHAPSACIVSSASAVDAMLKAKGLSTGSLYKRINEAATNHLITSEMAAWAHDIRLDANDERHAGDGAPIPNAQDAQKCIDFAFALAEYLFVLPSKSSIKGRAGAHNNDIIFANKNWRFL